MATFAYIGRSKSGVVKKGELVAKSRDEAAEQLRKQNLVVTSLEEKAAKEGFSFQLGSGVKEKDLVV
ncbi:MAG TPA: type II secretion system F family protein, partial [Nitrospira sp.]|nr:type II secretion system F family protein [Nitrospira sp.]